MKLKTLTVVLLLFVLGAIGITRPEPATAQSEDNLLKGLPVSGALSDGGTFDGSLTVSDLSINDADELVFTGLLNGTATLADGSTREISNQSFTEVVTLARDEACDILTLDLGPLNLDLLGLTVDLSEVELEINAVPGGGNLLGNLLCAVAGLLDADSPTSALGSILAQANEVLGDTLASLPVSGALSDGGSFDGTLTATDFSLNEAGELVVSGVLDGTATTGDGQTQEITNQAFSTTATLTSSERGEEVCDILQLNLDELNLDLLGLTVDLSPIDLDINAVPGAGNLLGNLLCAVAGLLDGTSIGDILNTLVGTLTDLLNGLLGAIPVTGTLPALRVEGEVLEGGTFDGTVTINNLSVDEENQLVVSGVLNGVVEEDDEEPQELTNVPFTTTATLMKDGARGGDVCDILQLDLGPLSLDLLGLTIDLSAIDLDINAVPGEGNLLGNLLCAVAGLLDPGSALGSLLDQVTSILGDSLAALPVSGALSDGGTFDGTMSINGFSLNETGELVVDGVLNGTATTSDGQTQEITDQAFSTTGSLVSGARGGDVCDILQLDLGPLSLDLLGLTVDLSAIDLDIDAVPGDGNLLGNLLCAVVGLLDGGTPLSDLLDDLLATINQILNGLLTNLPVVGNLTASRVSGSVGGGGTFDGTLSVQNLALNEANELEVSGLLNGTVETADGTLRQLTNYEFTTTLDASSDASCDILTLDLGPLNLDLLGLTVDLEPVSLDISAVPGEGNLLGNLLCAVAGLLDSDSPLGGLLEQLSGAVGDSLAALPVSGALSDGGTFDGTLSADSFSLNEAGELVVSGVLNGTATTGDGQTQEIVDQAFSTAAELTSGARGEDVCDILQLNLGELNLDLLGLTVDLLPIDLDINAVPGQGNLLGNLLCAVVGLLDGVTPAQPVGGEPPIETINQLLASANVLFPAPPEELHLIYIPMVFSNPD